MEVNTNPFPKLVDVDMVIIKWASNNKESNVETRGDMIVTNVVISARNHSTARDLSTKASMPKEILGMVENEKLSLTSLRQ